MGVDHLLDAAQGENVRLVHEIDNATGGANQDVAALLKLLALKTRGSTTIGDARTKHRAVAETTGLVKDLGGQLTSGADNQHKRLTPNSIARGKVNGARAWSGELLSLAHQLRKNGNQERASLSRA